MKPTSWIVRWSINQPGGEGTGIVGIYSSVRAAQAAALRSIQTNWVDGEWHHYPGIADQLKKLIVGGAYEDALLLWEKKARSYYEVGVAECEIEAEDERLTLEEMGME